MKTYKFWKKESAEFTTPNAKLLQASSLGRSNQSIEAASEDAKSRLKKVEARLRGALVPPKEDYSVDIREEVVQELDAKNVVTRNRYGALVLNSESLTLIDIDHAPKTFWQLLGFKPYNNKESIIAGIEKVAVKAEYSSLGFRIYETSKGIRLLVTGPYQDPCAAGLKLMRACSADPIFSMLCRKQKCYRARLSPKPYRIKQKGIKYQWPLESAELEQAKEWIKEYEYKSKNYAVCRYIKTLGSLDNNSIVEFHDKETAAFSSLALA